MPQSKRRRGFKACDPFCTDKVRKALYNRPNGPHMGKLVMGRTYLSGLDSKCFSRTGRIKKGYRNVPIDLQREFEIEKRQIQQIQHMIRGPNEKQKARRAEKKRLQKIEYEARKAKLKAMQQTANENKTVKQNNTIEDKKDTKPITVTEDKSDTKAHNIIEDKTDTKTSNNLMEHQTNIESGYSEMKIEAYAKPIQHMDKLERLPNEGFGDFIHRVKKTTSYFLNEKRNKSKLKKLKRREKNERYQQRKEQKKIDAVKLLKLEAKKKRNADRKWKRSIQLKKENVPFGATNDRPPVDLHKLGAELFGKRVHNKNNRNVNNLNVGCLSFANVIKERAQQLKQEEVRRNYAVMKQKRYADMKQNMKKKKKHNRRKVW